MNWLDISSGGWIRSVFLALFSRAQQVVKSSLSHVLGAGANQQSSSPSGWYSLLTAATDFQIIYFFVIKTTKRNDPLYAVITQNSADIGHTELFDSFCIRLTLKCTFYHLFGIFTLDSQHTEKKKEARCNSIEVAHKEIAQCYSEQKALCKLIKKKKEKPRSNTQVSFCSTPVVCVQKNFGEKKTLDCEMSVPDCH